MDIEKLDINAVCFGILCNFTPVCGEERAKEAVELVRKLQTENERLRDELEQVKRERGEAIKTIFQWVGCPECKWWDSADEWCEKYDREADSCGGCESPEWRGQEE